MPTRFARKIAITSAVFAVPAIMFSGTSANSQQICATNLGYCPMMQYGQPGYGCQCSSQYGYTAGVIVDISQYSYAPPSGGYAPPSGGYAPPSGGYAPPSGGYAPPSGGYAPPSGGYAPPSGGYAPPSGGYAPPSGGYAPPSGGYAPPSGGYAPPSGGYAPPSGGYAPPSGGYGPRSGGSVTPSAGAVGTTNCVQIYRQGNITMRRVIRVPVDPSTGAPRC
jgi:hypothetical protein